MAALLGYGWAWSQTLAEGLLASTICAVLATIVVALCFIVLFEQSRSRSVSANTLVMSGLLLVLLGVRWSQGDRQALDGAAMLGALLEAGLLTVLCLTMVRTQARAPFSERTGAWATKEWQGELWLGTTSVEQVLARWHGQGAAGLLSLPLAARYAAQSLASQWHTVEITGHETTADESGRWISVTLLHHLRDAVGKVKSTTTPVIVHEQVGNADYQALRQHLSSLDVQPPGTQQTDDLDMEPAVPIELAPALAALQNGQAARCLTLAGKHCQHPDLATRADAWRLCALSSASLRQWPEALAQFGQLFTLEGSAHNALQVATSAVMAGQLQDGERWFAQAQTLNQETQKVAPARLVTGYLSALEQAGEIAATRPYLDWLAQGYRAMHITDDHQVWTRGFPFFGEFLRKSLALLRQYLQPAELITWYERMLDDLDEPGRQRLEQHLAELRG